MNALPPANKVQQVVGVGAQARTRQATNIFAIQVTIDPANLAAGGLLDDTKRTLGVRGDLLLDQAELHGWATPRRAWNCPASPPWTKRSEEHTSELQSRLHLVCRLLLEKKK